MKKCIALIAIASFLMTGCLGPKISDPDAKPVQISQQDIQAWADTAEFVTQNATAIYLMEKPGARPVLVEVRNQLNAIATDTNTTPQQLEEIMKGLPFNELKSPKAQLLIGNGIFIYNRFLRQYINLDQAPNVSPFVIAIRNGLSTGLGEYVPSKTPPAVTPAAKPQ